MQKRSSDLSSAISRRLAGQKVQDGELLPMEKSAILASFTSTRDKNGPPLPREALMMERISKLRDVNFREAVENGTA